jgi:pyridoxal phosphate enzyme (YggS family)
MSEIERNLRGVRERIAEAALRSGRQPEQVRLVAVSKTVPVVAVVQAYHAGQRDFGENRVEEGAPKIAAVEAALGEAERPTWHMVGHIQSRKAADVAAAFDYVHSLDRAKLAERLSRYLSPEDLPLPVLLECNVSGEETKFGFDLAGWERDPGRLATFCEEVARILSLPNLSVQGLMTMAPWVADPETVRPVFASLRALRDVLRERFPALGWPELSMGMSDDFEVAIEEGATMVRIGRAIFGQRPG